ncbi:MAG: PAS domain S-box protein [Deltaproteobacteria bacterium]|nr:PAS domain S-box protein [Deltaproteobacteria bacterium]
MAKKPTYEELEQRVKEFDKEVQETKRRLEDIIETALFGIYELDNSGKFTYVSEYYCEMIGYEKKELIGEQFTKIIHEDDLSLTHNIFTRILQGESIRDTIKLKHGKGHFIHVSYITKTIYNEKGEAVGFRGSAEDISGRKQAEEALHQQNEYLLALHETSLGLINRLDMNELLEAIIERAALLAGTENGFIYLLDPGETEIKMRVGIGIYADLVGYGRLLFLGTPLVR